MTVKHGQIIEIPSIYDPSKTEIILMDDFEASVGELHEQAKLDHQRDHNHTVAQAELEGSALANGRRGLSHKNPSNSLAARKKREKEEATYRSLLKQLQDRLEEIYRQIEVINQRLDEIDTEISELERLKELAESELLDPTNPDHARLLKKYGITQEDIESGNLSVILAEQLRHRFDERTELQKRKESLQHQADEAIAEAQADNIITPAEADGFRQQMQSLEAGVSAQVRITQEASEELKAISIENNLGTYRGEKDSGELTFGESTQSRLSVAASLNGDGSYQKEVQGHSKNISLKDQFEASTNPVQDTPAHETVASQKIVSDFKNT